MGDDAQFPECSITKGGETETIIIYPQDDLREFGEQFVGNLKAFFFKFFSPLLFNFPSASYLHDLEVEELDFLTSDEEERDFEGFDVDEMSLSFFACGDCE